MRKLILAYSGSLGYYNPDEENQSKRFAYRNYSVNHPKTRSAYYLFCGIKKFCEQYPELRNQVKLLFWGLIDTRNIELARQMGIGENVEISGYISKEESLIRLQEANVFFLPLETGVNGHEPYALPGKLYEYLKIGKPVLALCTPSECERILEKSGIGIVCDPENINQLAETLKKLVENADSLTELYPLNQKYVAENFHARTLTNQLANVFNHVVQ